MISPARKLRYMLGSAVLVEARRAGSKSCIAWTWVGGMVGLSIGEMGEGGPLMLEEIEV